MSDHTLTIDNLNFLKACLLRPLPQVRYVAKSLPINLAIYPSAGELVSEWDECEFESNGFGVFKGAKFNHCIFNGTFNFYNCYIDGAVFSSYDLGIENLAFIGGGLKDIILGGKWHTCNFGPNTTEAIKVADDFWALEFIPRISCAAFGGVQLTEGVVAKILAGMCYDKEIIIPKRELVEQMMAGWRTVVGNCEDTH